MTPMPQMVTAHCNRSIACLEYLIRSIYIGRKLPKAKPQSSSYNSLHLLHRAVIASELIYCLINSSQHLHKV